MVVEEGAVLVVENVEELWPTNRLVESTSSGVTALSGAASNDEIGAMANGATTTEEGACSADSNDARAGKMAARPCVGVEGGAGAALAAARAGAVVVVVACGGGTAIAVLT